MSNVSYGIHSFEGPSGGTFPREETYTLAGGPGLTPTAVYVVYGASALTLDGRNATARLSVGAWDGTTQRVVCILGEDGAAAASADNGVRTDTDTVIQITGVNAATFQNEARAISFGTDSITLDWNSASGGHGYIVFFYCNAAKVGTSTSSASIGGTASVSGLGFQPDAIVAFGVNQAITANNGQPELMLSVGYSGRLPSVTQSCGVICAEDNQGNTSSGEIARTNRFLTTLTSAAGTVSEGTSLEMTSFDSGGFTYTTRDTAVAVTFGYLALDLDDRHCYAAAPLVAMGATGNVSVTGPGFTPEFLFTTAIRVATQDTINANQATISVGVSDGTTTACAAARVRDNQATSDTYSTASETALLFLVGEGTAADDAVANLDSFDADGFTIDVIDTSAGAENRALPYLAIEDRPAIVADDTESISDGAVLVYMAKATADDTESISDGVVLVIHRVVADDTETITDGVVLVTGTAGDLLIVVDETVTLTDHQQLVGSGVIVATDTVSISDATSPYLGNLLVITGETVSITDEFARSALIPTKAGARGTALQGGAEAGAILGAYAERGTSRG